MPHETTAATFYELLGSRFTHRGSLFRPDVHFYDQLTTDEGLQIAHKQLYGWLGIKPRQSHVSFANIQQPYIIAKSGAITISAEFQPHPYQAGALLALATMTHILTKHYEYSSDDQTIVLATIWSGLGLIVINGLVAATKTHVALHHALSGNWHASTGITLPTQTPAAYGAQLATYIHEYSIDPSEAFATLTPQARKLIDLGYYIPPSAHPPLPKQIHAHHKAARVRWASLGLHAATAATLCILILYVLAKVKMN